MLADKVPAIARLPLTVNVPGPETPGANVPPLLIVSVFVEEVAKILPVPPKVAPEATVTPVVAFNAPVTDKMPAETVVVPLCVLVPDKVKVPVPLLVKLLAPPIAPDNVTAALLEIVVAPLNVTLLVNVVAPVISSVVLAPIVNVPILRLPAEEMRNVPDVTEVVPL